MTRRAALAPAGRWRCSLASRRVSKQPLTHDLRYCASRLISETWPRTAQHTHSQDSMRMVHSAPLSFTSFSGPRSSRSCGSRTLRYYYYYYYYSLSHTYTHLYTHTGTCTRILQICAAVLTDAHTARRAATCCADRRSTTARAAARRCGEAVVRTGASTLTQSELRDCS